MKDESGQEYVGTLKPIVRARIIRGVIAYVFDGRFCIHGVTVKQQCPACIRIANENARDIR